ncbi:dTDP-4-dehydrorhamnose reductase [Zobellella iuensis]|uniref:dTDP-4-dehydrorhamnose reductase n=1 Tax=Zobellella iuensis TaxID=2803811 RepID=A0ABS1QPP2_9GAMM|nr:dTDP-4-dehydrorhamnose reductase [Zobellella iuensis]MBL1376552.1 dTDP-4-dehydrorhamnose reductase [Zobellella iuensis]
MSNMRVLVIGAYGQVGSELMSSVPAGLDVRGLGSAELDISNAGQLEAVITEVNPAFIVNAAAYTAVDKAESESERAWQVNALGVKSLAQAAARQNIPVLHISTDYVFSGNARHPYKESDTTGPNGVYGASKLAGELLLSAYCARHIILRTSWVFGTHGNNFVKTMIRLGQERDKLGVVADQFGGPTAAAAIARAIWTLVGQYQQQGELAWGTYHFSGAPACSWHEFATEIFAQAERLELIKSSPSLEAIATSQYPTPARRPSWSVLDGEKLNTTFGVAPPDWRDELVMVLQQLQSMKR